MKKKALGKGLKAFLPEEYSILKEEKFIEVYVEKFKPTPHQPRSNFNPETLEELARSIKETGMLQPIVAVPEENYYKIIVGERRWRAAQKAGLKKIPTLIRKMTKPQQYEASLIENLQREDLNPMDIATAYQRMTLDLNYTQQEIAKKVGKDRASVANYMRLLKLPEEIQEMLLQNQLSMGHARALITIKEAEVQVSFARQIIKKNLSVRNIEKTISKIKDKPQKKQKSALDPDLMALQDDFIKLLSTKVAISGSAKKGIVKIHYFSLDELNRIYDKLKGAK